MNSQPQLIRGRIFDGVADRGPGSIEIADGLIVQLHYGPDAPAAGSAAVVDLSDQLITPGLVDVHSHGGGGVAFDPAMAQGGNHRLGHRTADTGVNFVEHHGRYGIESHRHHFDGQ